MSPATHRVAGADVGGAWAGEDVRDGSGPPTGSWPRLAPGAYPPNAATGSGDGDAGYRRLATRSGATRKSASIPSLPVTSPRHDPCGQARATAHCHAHPATGRPYPRRRRVRALRRTVNRCPPCPDGAKDLLAKRAALAQGRNHGRRDPRDAAIRSSGEAPRLGVSRPRAAPAVYCPPFFDTGNNALLNTWSATRLPWAMPWTLSNDQWMPR